MSDAITVGAESYSAPTVIASRAYLELRLSRRAGIWNCNCRVARVFEIARIAFCPHCVARVFEIARIAFCPHCAARVFEITRIAFYPYCYRVARVFGIAIVALRGYLELRLSRRAGIWNGDCRDACVFGMVISVFYFHRHRASTRTHA